MNKLTLILSVVILCSGLTAQTVSGSVTDGNGNPLPGANVSLGGTEKGAATDATGAYTISEVSQGSYTLTASYIGYEDQSKGINVGSDGATVNFSLNASALSGAKVLVTGTRSAGRSAMKSPTPIDGFNELTLRRQGNGDFTETVKNQVPSFNATPYTGDGAAFVRPTSMRGLPPDNILVLTNSKRRHRSSLISHFGAAMNVGAQAVDVGMIPSIAIKRLEVLRDGASAQYGSDAIAGVMNFILKDNSEGIEIHASGGNWMTAPNERGGETDVTLAGNIGLPLGNNGFLNVSAEYSDRPELSRGNQHASASDGYKGWSASGNQDVSDWQTAMNWGRPENSGFRSVWNAGLDLGDNVEAYSFGNYAKTFGEYSFFLRAAGKSGALTAIPLDPADPSKGNFSWGDTYPLGFTPRLEGHGNDFSTVIGIRGEDLGGFGVDYDFSGSYGSNYIHYYLKNSLNLSWGPYSPHNFIIGDLQQEESNWNADFTYALSDAINLAFGLEKREEIYTMYEGQKEAWMAGPWATVHLLVDPVATAAAVAASGNADTTVNYTAPGLAANGMPGTDPSAAGEFARQNTAYYADAEWDLSDDLLILVAARMEDFSDFGATTNFKLAGRYSLGNIATFRGSYSTGFRAPTPGQSNYTGVVTSFDGVTGMQVQEGTLKPDDPLSVLMGGKALVPEEATNTSFGFTTSLLPNLNLTVDMYNIDVTNKIIKSRSLTVPEGSSASFTDIAIYTNSVDTKTSGIDIVAVYDMGKTDIALAMNTNSTEVVLPQRQVNGVNPVTDGGVFNIENNLPKIRLTATVGHDINQNLSALVRVNYYGETSDEQGGREDVAATQLIDLELNYRLSGNMSVVFGVNNALNTYPTHTTGRVSQGMPYPRRTPIGYHGGMTYLRLMYNF
jgi:iron complex outermembrane receptor protein